MGKTTCAAAAAVRAAAEGARVLVVSTDPAHSLGDALDVRLGREPRAVTARLWAAELDADRALRRWLGDREEAIRTVASRGTYLDDEDIDRLLSLSFPGADELVGLVELMRLARKDAWDEVVVDTAPTGHTLRLLAMPDTLAELARILDGMHAKHRFLAGAIAGAWRPDFADEAIAEIAEDAAELRRVLREDAWFTWVTTPAELPVLEATRGVVALREMGLRVGRVVVNRVWPAPPRPCGLCSARVNEERRHRDALARAFPGCTELPAALVEPRGLRALLDVAYGRVPAETTPSAPRLTHARRPLDLGDRRLVLVGGKGGVGKTTTAAALALDLAGGGRRVLLLSTDPAHSLGDAFGVPIGDDPVRVAPRLHARELDATRAWDELRERYRRGVTDLFASIFRGSMDATFDRHVLEDLLGLAPPGIDELVAVLTILDALDAGHDAIVLDTAPTGHTLRLLALPGKALEWVHAIMRIVLKYRQIVGLGDFASDLTELARRLRRLGELLVDPAQAGFVVVTRAAELPRRETTRLLAELARRDVPVAGVLVNEVTAPDCPRCAAAAALEAPSLAKMGPHWEAPALAPAPRGERALARLSRTWVYAARARANHEDRAR